MRRLLIILAGLVAAPAAQATSLRVSPILLDVRAPGAAATVTLRNDEARPLDVQIRVFRWTQVQGKDVLEPTTDVVASPPMAALAPQAEYVVRVVRVTKRPMAAEESYRLVVDELPNPAERRNGTVTFVLRYSIPVFFGAGKVADASVAWTARRSGNAYVVSATNSGGKRLRVSNLTLNDAHGALQPREGLVGYVLPGATMTWPVRSGRRLEGQAKLAADTETGPINATILLGPAR